MSGFNYEEGIDGPAWITTNATMSGGSSGGAALDRAVHRLVVQILVSPGVPGVSTQRRIILIIRKRDAVALSPDTEHLRSRP